MPGGRPDDAAQRVGCPAGPIAVAAAHAARGALLLQLLPALQLCPPPQGNGSPCLLPLTLLHSLPISGHLSLDCMLAQELRTKGEPNRYGMDHFWPSFPCCDRQQHSSQQACMRACTGSTLKSTHIASDFSIPLHCVYGYHCHEGPLPGRSALKGNDVIIDGVMCQQALELACADSIGMGPELIILANPEGN